MCETVRLRTQAIHNFDTTASNLPPCSVRMASHRSFSFYSKILDTFSRIALSQYTCNAPNNTPNVISYHRNHPEPGL